MPGSDGTGPREVLLDALRGAFVLSTLVRETVVLERSGREWRGACPFHADGSPGGALFVDDARGVYHCYACHAHGDAIRWLMGRDGIGLADAAGALARGVVQLLEPITVRRDGGEVGEALEAASAWFRAQLRRRSNVAALDYLHRRGVTDAEIEAFGIGYAPDGRDGLRRALGGFDEAVLIEAGLLIGVGAGTPYDRFRGRIMFPVRSATGATVGFTGRLVGTGEPKFLTSPDRTGFAKAGTLFNLDRAEPHAARSGRVFVVEGCLDVVALARIGVPNAVCQIGIAISTNHLERLWSIAPTIVAAMDGNAAGRRASLALARLAAPLIAIDCQLELSDLPAGLDPDDLVASGRGEELLRSLLSARSADRWLADGQSGVATC